MSNPIRTFEVYWCEGKLLGYEIEHKSYPRSAQGYAYSHFLSGKNAAFCIVSHDGTINRRLAICFAAAVHAGKFVKHHISLDVVNDKRLWK